jgi:TetR/AcrR family transcriptional regulator, transcriptional repressor for nem operon
MTCIILVVKRLLKETELDYSQADKADTHDRVVKIAATKFREAGIDGISVADLMKETGLTHGGFYRHFESRDALVAEAVECVMAHSAQLIAEAASPGQNASLAALIDSYLNTAHRDAPAEGCAIVALGSDVARSHDQTRTAYTQQVEWHLHRQLDRWCRWQPCQAAGSRGVQRTGRCDGVGQGSQ